MSDKEQPINPRLDVYIQAKRPELSRSQIHKLIDRADVLVNKAPSKASRKIKPNDVVTIDYSPDKELPKVEVPIIYEDDDCLVLNKPTGLLTHSKGSLNPEATVASFIADKVQDVTGERAGIVHRLDRATSGVIICAKTAQAQSWLQKQFSQRKAKKTYYAIVDGHLEPSEAIIDMPVGRNPAKPKTFHVSSNGRQASTHYKVIKSSQRFDLVELKPTTGRTHQLRVHLSHQGHPIAGDDFYQGTDAGRLFLHAFSLELTLPNRQRKVFSAELPDDFDAMLERDGNVTSK